MRYWALPSLLLAYLLLLPSIAVAWSGKVAEVTVGGTLVIMKGNKEVDVRLYGIDTPEKAQAGTKAKRFAVSLAGGEKVEVSKRTAINMAGWSDLSTSRATASVLTRS